MQEKTKKETKGNIDQWDIIKTNSGFINIKEFINNIVLK